MDTPFITGAGRGTASNTLFEWQKDELAAAAANQKKEGDDPASLAVSEPTKLQNYTQISEKAVDIRHCGSSRLGRPKIKSGLSTRKARKRNEA
jgi:hypothetical protein